MPSRHRSRQRALQVLFQSDMRDQPAQEAISTCYGSLWSEDGEPSLQPDPFMEHLVQAATVRLDEIDRRIAEHSEHWRLDRMPVVDRNILRLAVCEILETSTPPAVVIDEALELARRFSGDESVAFINGVLDAILRQVQPGDAITDPPPENQ